MTLVSTLTTTHRDRATGFVRWRVIRQTLRLSFLTCCVSAAAVIAVAFLPAAQANASTPAWSVTGSPNLNNTANQLLSVSCTSPDWCMSVGSFNDGVTQPMSAIWNGKWWAFGAAPVDPNSVLSQLLGVSCVSPTSCLAVGYYQQPNSFNNETLVESWNGLAWSIVSSPSPGTSSQLSGVSCFAPSDCWAVGNTYTGSTNATLEELWDNGSWTDTSQSVGTHPSYLYSVSCPTLTSCTAVGFYYNGSVDRALAVSFDGTNWKLTAIHDRGSEANYVEAVSCATATHCVAVGSYYNGSQDQTLIDTWNGTSWSVAKSPDVGSSTNLLYGISCATSTRCMAVGFWTEATGSEPEQPLALSLKNGSWSVSKTVTPGSANTSGLQQVSCASATSCMAVGGFFPPPPEYANISTGQNLAESWREGSWSITLTPNQLQSVDSLADVSCSSTTSCAAVGWWSSNGSADATLGEIWNGSAWVITTTPDNGREDNYLVSVSCSRPSRCMAVGNYDTSSGTETLAESWNGKRWSIVPTPHLGPNSALSAVACTSSSMCIAVGQHGSAALVESWNGTKWSVLRSPHRGSADLLDGVSCTSSRHCVAVGYYSGDGSGAVDTLVESWNGTTWSVVSSPNPSKDFNFVLAVSCASASSCMAVGEEEKGSDFLNMAERFNGKTWEVTKIPDPSSTYDQLNGVSCSTSASCVTVGYSESHGIELALGESWNGHSWSNVTPADPSATSYQLSGVSCASASHCMAVGGYVPEFDNPFGTQTLIETGP